MANVPLVDLSHQNQAQIGCVLRRPYDLGGAAEYLHFSKATIYKLVSAGKIACSKPGGKKLLFLEEDLDAFVRRHRREAVEVLADRIESAVDSPAEPRLRGRRGGAQ